MQKCYFSFPKRVLHRMEFTFWMLPKRELGLPGNAGVDIVPQLMKYRTMLGKPKNRFSFTCRTLCKLGRARSNSLIFFLLTSLTLILGWKGTFASAQPSAFAGDAQHTAQFNARGQGLNRLLWTTTVDETSSFGSWHYGA